MEVKPEEHNKIIDYAQDDGHIDKDDKELLFYFQKMLSNVTINRVKGWK